MSNTNERKRVGNMGKRHGQPVWIGKSYWITFDCGKNFNNIQNEKQLETKKRLHWKTCKECRELYNDKYRDYNESLGDGHSNTQYNCKTSCCVARTFRDSQQNIKE